MTSTARHSLTAIALVVISLIATSCGNSPKTTVRPLDPTVNIGVVLSLTGPDAPIGRSQEEAINLANQQFNESPGARFHMTIMNEAAGTAGVGRLLNKHVAAILGPTHSSFATQMYSQVDIAETPTLGLSLTVPGLTAFRPFLWRVSISDDRTIPPALAAAASATDATSAYVIYTSDNLFTVAEKEIFETALSTDGINLLGESSFLSGQENLSTVIAAVEAASPNLICVAAESTDAVRVLQQLRASGLDQPVIGGDGFNSSAVLVGAGAAANNVYVGSAWAADNPLPSSRAFVRAFRRTYGTMPDDFAAQAYAGMQVLREAVRIGGPTRGGIQNGFAKISGVPTILGRFSFDISRDAVFSPFVNHVINGHLTSIPS